MSDLAEISLRILSLVTRLHKPPVPAIRTLTAINNLLLPPPSSLLPPPSSSSSCCCCSLLFVLCPPYSPSSPASCSPSSLPAPPPTSLSHSTLPSCPSRHPPSPLYPLSSYSLGVLTGDKTLKIAPSPLANDRVLKPVLSEKRRERSRGGRGAEGRTGLP